MRQIVDSEKNPVNVGDRIAYTYRRDSRVYSGTVTKLLGSMIEIDTGGTYSRYQRRDG